MDILLWIGLGVIFGCLVGIGIGEIIALSIIFDIKDEPQEGAPSW